jgi:prepilin-type N-terminal cleavage/methylation domain-containing protein
MFKKPKTTNQKLTVRCQRSKVRMSGFTLIELLIVVAIIAILAVVVFVALNPLKRFQDARDSTRWNDANAYVDAIKLHQVDNGGRYLYGVLNYGADNPVVDGSAYMIGVGTTTTNCNLNCSVVAGIDACVNLNSLISGGYLGDLPVSPGGNNSWTSQYTGYYLIKNNNNATGTITVVACDVENTPGGISVTK